MTAPNSGSPDPAPTLERRLNDGWLRIAHATAKGDDTTSWEDFWIDLLHQYEAAMDEEEPRDVTKHR